MKSLVMFNLWRGMSSKDSENLGADYRYWSNSDIKDSLYFPGVPIGILKTNNK